MGSCLSVGAGGGGHGGGHSSSFRPIPDQFTTYEQVQQALRDAGLESSSLIVGVDFTKSNQWTGAKTFAGACLHDMGNRLNPYQEVIDMYVVDVECWLY